MPVLTVSQKKCLNLLLMTFYAGVLQTKKLKLLVFEVPTIAPVLKLTTVPDCEVQILKA